MDALPEYDPKDYKSLEITAKDPKTEIWVGDEEGNFVQKEVGRLWTRLLPGKYTVSFGLKNTRHSFELKESTELFEASFT